MHFVVYRTCVDANYFKTNDTLFAETSILAAITSTSAVYLILFLQFSANLNAFKIINCSAHIDATLTTYK